ncbi:allantoinase AllB [Telmatobacter sp. DSM 110680]|uniref:allantoinase n=1 Tax=Telmatobacter sp. DSM 110680 TaxID=3036704 RepID=A0AAU7DN08_9BACT
MAQALRSTRVLTAEGLTPATVIIDGEKIAAIRAWHEVRQSEDLHDFGDLLLLPGLVDSHVHINDPGRDWEGFDTATRAAASGGVTTLVDMPLNCVPETVTVEALAVKRRAASARAWVDWAAWGGVVKGNADEIPALAQTGVPGFKCFMIDSGIDSFAWVDENAMRRALDKLRGTGLPLLVHAEVAEPVEEATRALKDANWQRYSTYLASRPDAAEVEAIRHLIRLAQEYQTPIHIVHLSSAKALPMLAEARNHGVPITVETCVHYLALAAEQIRDGATEFKCAPPIRDEANCQQLWAALESGLIDLVATDHSPCPPAMKRRDAGRWDVAWGGIASLGLALPVLWTVMRQRGLSTEDAATRVAKWMAARPARLAGLLNRKGSIAVGVDADIAVFDPHISWTVTESDLHFRHKLSPYLGAKLRGRVQETWLRGEQVFSDGQFQGDARGREMVRT